jgi:hypothetical protein
MSFVPDSHFEVGFQVSNFSDLHSRFTRACASSLYQWDMWICAPYHMSDMIIGIE